MVAAYWTASPRLHRFPPPADVAPGSLRVVAVEPGELSGPVPEVDP
jgi:hypothetical protein